MAVGTAIEFPAHAGMNRANGGAWDGRRRVPRTRGDEPGDPDGLLDELASSPHTRG